MSREDLFNNLANAVTTLPPATRTAAATGATVSLLGFRGALIQAVVGTITDGVHTLTVEQLIGGVWSVVPAALLQGSFVALATGVNQKVGYLGTAESIRVNAAASGATGGVYSAIVIRGGARRLPV